MTTIIKYVGRTTNFKGKSLWEIVGNLRNFGVGRYVIRSAFQRYPEPCYMRILKVEALPDEENRKVRVYVERVFRGLRYEKPIELESTSYKTDYQLMPIDWTPPALPEVKIREVKGTIELPPLLMEYIKRDWETNEVPPVPVKLQNGVNNRYKIASS